MAMATERTQTDKNLLADLARGGFAESLSPNQRRQIHIQTELDEFLHEAIKKGKQVVLTGNPGDGKTQHILMCQDQHPADEGYYYLLDASEYSDYGALLDEWNEAYIAGRPGILAINDGPLYEMTTTHRNEFSFLPTVYEQLQHQVVYTDDEAADVAFDDIVVVDLNNREVLTPSIIREAIETFATDFATKGHSHAGRCHIQYNAQKLQDEYIQENLIDFLTQLGTHDIHVTVRDLLNFICYILTAGLKECQTNFDDDLKYYNLAFEGSGTVFELARQQFTAPELVHPFVDSQLWAAAEQEASFSDRDDAAETVTPLFREKKRRFLFEDAIMNIGYESRALYQNLQYDFINHRNGMSTEGIKEEFLKMLNGYFRPDNPRRAQLQLWLSHRYRSKSSLALVSRTTVDKSEFEIQRPNLHPAIRETIGYTPSHMAVEYTGGDEPIRLRITRSLYSELGALDANIPYTLRDRDVEQQILEFMEEIEYHESYSEEAGTVSVKDTATGRVETVEINDDTYRQ